jgi:hypothetical protein
MLKYADTIEQASTVVVHNYIQLDEDDDPEGFQMSSEKWPKGTVHSSSHAAVCS